MYKYLDKIFIWHFFLNSKALSQTTEHCPRKIRDKRDPRPRLLGPSRAILYLKSGSSYRGILKKFLRSEIRSGYEDIEIKLSTYPSWIRSCDRAFALPLSSLGLKIPWHLFLPSDDYIPFQKLVLPIEYRSPYYAKRRSLQDVLSHANVEEVKKNLVHRQLYPNLPGKWRFKQRRYFVGDPGEKSRYRFSSLKISFAFKYIA